MRIRAGYRIGYDCPVPTPMMLMLNVRPERQRDLETPDTVLTTPDVPVRQYIDTFGNICSRLVAPAGRFTIHSDFVIHDTLEKDPQSPDAIQHAVEDLPDHTIEYLLPSRYCDVELLRDLAWKLFADVPPGWARVQAIVDYAHNRVQFGYAHARPTKTAFEAHEEQQGVCRDYAHLAVTLCRAMNIPARYCTGYLGEFDVTPSGAPMDYSAWFEVWLGDGWHTFDARHNFPRNGRLLMAVGRDATDVAITTTFGFAKLVQFEVICEEAV